MLSFAQALETRSPSRFLTDRQELGIWQPFRDWRNLAVVGTNTIGGRNGGRIGGRIGGTESTRIARLPAYCLPSPAGEAQD